MKIKYRKIFIDEDPKQPEPTEPCPACKSKGIDSKMEYMYINMDLAVFKCTSTTCMYPHTNFKYKNYSDQTVYRLEVLEVTHQQLTLPTPPPQPAPPLPAAAPAVVDDFGTDFGTFFDNPTPQAAFSYQSHSVDSGFLDNHDTKYDIKPDAMEKLESELHDLLSAHLDLGDTSPKKESVKKEPNPVRPPDLKLNEFPSTSEATQPKRRRLSKAYEFLERKLGVKCKPATNQDEPFKVPARPSRADGASSSGGEKRRRRTSSSSSSTSPRSHRKDYKLPKEVKSPVKLQPSSLFLKNIERQHVLLKDLNPDRIQPIKIEVLDSASPSDIDVDVDQFREYR